MQGEEQYEDTMKVLVDMGFNIKDQVKKNGKALLSISSPQSLMGIIKEYDYQIVKDNVQLIRDNYPNATKILTGGLSVFNYVLDIILVKIKPIESQKMILKSGLIIGHQQMTKRIYFLIQVHKKMSWCLYWI